ncbi:hypothetical protein [Clostridium sp. DL1XJH146]
MAFKLNMSKIKSTASGMASTAVDAAQKGAEKVSQKSGEVIETTKLNGKISTEEKKIKDIYYEIGKTLYENYKFGVAVDSDIAEFCVKIDESNGKIEEFKEEIQKIKSDEKL